MARDNAVRYLDVYPDIDIQYTVLNDTVKEDILLLKPQSRNTFSYRLKSDTLRFKKDGNAILAHKGNAKKPVFALTAPVMTDADGAASTAITVSYNSGTNTVTYTADEEWLQAEDRAYPVRIDPAGATLVDSSVFKMNMVAKGGDYLTDESMRGDGAPNYYFGLNNNTLVGYSKDRGYSRMLLTIDANWESLMGSNTSTEGPGILAVELRLRTVTGDAPDNTLFAAFVPSKTWDPYTITWNRMKAEGVDSGMAMTGTPQTSSGVDQEMTFDITQVYDQWLKQPETRTGLMIQAYVEAGDDEYRPDQEGPANVSWGETFYNPNSGSENGPCLRLAWTGTLNDGDLANMDMSQFSVNVDPGVVESDAGGRDVLGVLAHGGVQTDAEVEYRLIEKNSGEVESGSVTGGDSVEMPDFLQVDDDCIPAEYLDSNWQSDPLMTGDSLSLNQIYYIEARATGKALEEDEEGNLVPGEEEVTTEWKTTDEFLLYEVQASDILPRIARHYGVSANRLREDNRLNAQLAEAGNVLFIRTPQTADPYTAAIEATALEKFILECLLNGLDPRCEVGGEPVNLSTGSFYMSQTDASFTELGGDFVIERSYNGKMPYFRSEFGMGWNSLVGERIMVLANGSILYTTETGKGLVFTKEGDHYDGPDGYDYTLRPVNQIQLPVGSGDDGEDPDTDTEIETETIEAGTGGPGAKARLLLAADDDAEDTEDGDTETDGTEDGDDSIETVMPATGWEITEPDGTVRVFNAYGLLVSRGDRKGHKTSYVYDSDSLLTEIITPSGRSLGITSLPDGKITEITLPDGNTLGYAYDEEDNLIQVTNPEGGTRTYEYDENHRMTAWYDENGTRIIDNVLDEEGRDTEQTAALGNTMYFSYGDSETVVTDNNGNRTVYTLDEQKRNIRILYATGEEESKRYDGDNRLQAVTDGRGETSTYTYDEEGNLLTETRSDGEAARFTYDAYAMPLTATDYEGNTLRYTYDAKGNLLSLTDGEGHTTRYGYDELSRLVSMTDANGGTHRFTYEGNSPDPASYRDPEGGTTTFTYDGMGRLLSQTDPEGRTTTHAYNGNGWETETVQADGGTTTYVFSPAGEVLSITDPMGAVTTFTYDGLHHLLTGEDALGNTLAYVYDGNYNRILETDGKGGETSYTYDARTRITAMSVAVGHTISYTLDGNGNVTETVDRRGYVSETWYHKSLNLPLMVRDGEGNETYYAYTANGDLETITYPDGASVRYAYDRAGRMTSSTDQSGLVTEIAYDGNGNVVRISDDESRVYRFAYDGNNRLLETTDPLGGVTRYAYDGSGNQTEVTDALGHASEYRYDALGRLLAVTDALGHTASASYDYNGNLLSSTDQNGHTGTLHYDVIGQLLASQDAAGNVTAMEYDILGNVTKLTDALKGETTLQYDALSQAVEVRDALGGNYRYEYDENGNVLSVTMPDGDRIAMTYDGAGHLAS